MDPVIEVARRYDLFIIEDAAEQHGNFMPKRIREWERSWTKPAAKRMRRRSPVFGK
jgi:hypothetical protein